MDREKSPTAYSEVIQVVTELHHRIEAILHENFMGMYLYGSLAMGGFEPTRSDIDFVVITVDLLDKATIDALELMHNELVRTGGKWVKKLEGAYVPKAVIRQHDLNYPAVPTLNEGKFYMATLGGDWIIQRHILREFEAIISGPPPRDFIDPVSSEEIKSAVHEVIERWWQPMLEDPTRLESPGYQPFAVLSMCRAAHTLSTGKVSSKSEAANWAVASLGEEWAGLIRQAMKWGEGDDIESIEQTTAFMSYVLNLCKNL